jgi:hypothetical protein
MSRHLPIAPVDAAHNAVVSLNGETFDFLRHV